jgi:hypothetical protein
MTWRNHREFLTRELSRLEAARPAPPRAFDGAALDRLLLETVLHSALSATAHCQRGDGRGH